MVTLDDEAPELVEHMISTLYSGDYIVEHDPNADGAWPLLIHAHLYAMGDKFGIAALRYCAVKKTALELRHRETSWHNDIIPTARVIWSTTLSSDRGLRNQYIKHFLVTRTSMMNDDENIRKEQIEALRSVPDLAHDILIAE